MRGWRIGQRVKVISNEVVGYGKVGSVRKIESGRIVVALDNGGPIQYDPSSLRKVRKFG